MPKAARNKAPRLATGSATERSPRSAADAKPTKPKRRKARLTTPQLVAAALDDLKAQQVSALDVRHLTTVTDTMIIASGRSDRHVRSLADHVVERCKEAGVRPLGVEGEKAGEWVLVDLGDTVVHVMLPRVREFYNLEKLWDISARAETVDVGVAAGV